jgi:hypothetical protein
MAWFLTPKPNRGRHENDQIRLDHAPQEGRHITSNPGISPFYRIRRRDVFPFPTIHLDTQCTRPTSVENCVLLCATLTHPHPPPRSYSIFNRSSCAPIDLISPSSCRLLFPTGSLTNPFPP